MAEQWDARNKTFIITGGANGLGLECVKAFLDLHAKSIAILDVAAENVFAQNLNKINTNKVIFIKCNSSKQADIGKAFKDVLSKFKRIDVIINLVGDIKSKKPILWKTGSTINWKALVSFTLRGMNYMRKDKGGVGGMIVNILSTATLTQFPYIPVYNGSKTTLMHFSQCISMAPYYENTNVRILNMCFESTVTPLTQNLTTQPYKPDIDNNDTDIATVITAAVQTKLPVFDFVDMDNGWYNLIIS